MFLLTLSSSLLRQNGIERCTRTQPLTVDSTFEARQQTVVSTFRVRDFDELNSLHRCDNYSENRGNVFATMPSTNKKCIIYTNLCRRRLVDLTRMLSKSRIVLPINENERELRKHRILHFTYLELDVVPFCYHG